VTESPEYSWTTFIRNQAIAFRLDHSLEQDSDSEFLSPRNRSTSRRLRAMRLSLSNTTLVRVIRILLTVSLISGISSNAHGAFGSPAVASMKLVAPSVGWATTGINRIGYGTGDEPTNLFWTTDKGVHWRDITPNPLPQTDSQAEPEHISDVFFLDTPEDGFCFVAVNSIARKNRTRRRRNMLWQ
jgi:hypothetical protein